MFSSLDIFICVSVAVSFFVFILLKIVILRMVHPEAVLRWIVNIFLMSSVVHCVGLALVYGHIARDLPGGFMFAAGVSYSIFVLLAFVYIVCVFGPSETSIRIRIVRELAQAKGGRLTHDELIRRYNGRLILERRLKRLILAQEIIEQNGTYVLRGKANAFFLIDAVANWISKTQKRCS